MGRVRTPKFELQFKDTEGRHLITGVDSFREALKKIELHFSDNPKDLTGDVYLWGNSATGRRIIEDKGGDYLYLNFKKGERKFRPMKIQIEF